jgi:hypothetical protein
MTNEADVGKMHNHRLVWQIYVSAKTYKGAERGKLLK